MIKHDYTYQERLEDKPLTLDEAITILEDGRPIRRSLRRAAIEVVRKAQVRLNAFDALVAESGDLAKGLEKQVAKNMIDNFEKDTRDMIRLLRERFDINE